MAAAAGFWLRGAGNTDSGDAPEVGRVTAAEQTGTPAAAGSAQRVATPAAKPAATRVVVQSEGLPPADAPLAQTYATLKARADAGDAAAASRLYRDVARCVHARDVLNNEARAASWILEDDTSKLDAGQLARRERRLGNIGDELAKAQASSALCNDATPQQLLMAPAALRAAQLGDTQAADCYVGSGLIAGGGLLDHPEWLQEYKDNALPLANNAIAQGDWTMVAQLQRAYAQSNNAGLLGQVTGADPSQAYAYMKLRSLGAVTPQGQSFLGRELEQSAQNLPADAVSAGDAWAQDTYQKNFSANPQNTTPRGFNPCQNFGG